MTNDKMLIDSAKAAGWNVYLDRMKATPTHPSGYKAFECLFAAKRLQRLDIHGPVLDIGSYQHFAIGLSAAFVVETIDVREVAAWLNSMYALYQCTTGNGADLPADMNNCYNAVVALSSIEHFGLGRYGDPLNLNADREAVKGISRVLHKNGHLIFSVSIANNCVAPTLAFNAHRVYTPETIHALCENAELTLDKEAFYNRSTDKPCLACDLTKQPAPGVWDVYCGDWIKQ